MIYKFFEFFIKISVRLYFKKIEISGREHLPKNQPVLFVANHPGAFMDPIVIGTSIDRPLYYLARGESFKNKFSAWFFRQIHMIPVYRKEETPELAHKNKDIFSACIRHFEKGKSIMIFPEGTSKIEPRLRQVKTGAARIALSAEDENDFELGLKIVPIGLNYSNSKNFRTDVHVNIGEPIDLIDYKEVYQQDKFVTAKKLTKDLEEAIKKQMFLIEQSSHDNLFKAIEKVYLDELRLKVKTATWTEVDELSLKNTVVNAMEYVKEQHHEKFLQTESDIEEYTGFVCDLEKRYPWFNKSYFNASSNQSMFKLFTVLTIGLPFFLLGFTINYLPYRFVGLLTNKFSQRDDFTGGLRLVLGMFTFQLYYIFAGIELYHWVFPFATFGVVLFPLLGLFALGYYRIYSQFKTILGIRKMERKQPFILKKITELRANIINDLEVARLLYNKAHGIGDYA